MMCLAILIAADRIAHIVDGVTVSPIRRLRLDPKLHRIGEKNIHRHRRDLPHIKNDIYFSNFRQFFSLLWR